jgi:nucleotide-binding universal stress UspA family protein
MIAQHILVPIDFSAAADQALEYAMALAGKLSVRLPLLHVMYTAPLAAAEGGAFLPDLESIKAEARQRMERYRQRVHAAGLEGDVIIMAQDKKVDLIVMGTHGRTGLQHVLLGSVAEKVVRLAPCPVLTIRYKAGVA